MTEPTVEPSNADLLAFMQQAFAHLTTELGKTNAAVGALSERVDAGFERVDSLAAELSGVREELRGEIRATEARLSAKISDVQRVVQSLKGDLAAHVHDPDAHRRAA